MHLLTCEAYDLAESQLRLATRLNPYEPRFKAHLAWCLFKKGLYEEASVLLAKIPERERDDHIRAIARAVARGSGKREAGK